MIAVLVAVVAAVAPACSAAQGEVSGALPALEGESVVDGSPLSSEDFAGDVLVINAWATWCVPCRTEQPALIRVFDAYRDRGVSFLGIDHLDDRASATHWIEEEFQVPYPSLFDPAGEFAAKLGYPGLPATFVVDETGRIRFRRFGPITEERLIGMLDRVLEG
jgi:cytochrome c biogenesis protein CcmG/thiol:disulfide interchange protein DsbE